MTARWQGRLPPSWQIFLAVDGDPDRSALWKEILKVT